MAIRTIEHLVGKNFMPHTARDTPDLAAAGRACFDEARGDRGIICPHAFSPMWRMMLSLIRHDTGCAARPAMVASNSSSLTGKGNTIVLLRSFAITFRVER